MYPGIDMHKMLTVFGSALLALCSGGVASAGRPADEPPSDLLKQREALSERLDALASRAPDDGKGGVKYRLSQWYNWGNWPNGWSNWRNW